MSVVRLLAVMALVGSAPFAAAQTVEQQMRNRAAVQERQRVENELTGANTAPRDHRGRVLSPGQITSAAKNAVKAAGLSCKVTESSLLGVTNDDAELFEVACEGGPGYILTNAKPGISFDCPMLATNAEAMRKDGITPPPNSTCVLKANLPAG